MRYVKHWNLDVSQVKLSHQWYPRWIRLKLNSAVNASCHGARVVSNTYILVAVQRTDTVLVRKFREMEKVSLGGGEDRSLRSVHSGPDREIDTLRGQQCMQSAGRKVPLFSRHTTSTALRLAVGHAFTAEYTCWFRPDLPLEVYVAPWLDHSFAHLLYTCPRGHEAQHPANPLL